MPLLKVSGLSHFYCRTFVSLYLKGNEKVNKFFLSKYSYVRHILETLRFLQYYSRILNVSLYHICPGQEDLGLY
jgi:hypothetical protein